MKTSIEMKKYSNILLLILCVGFFSCEEFLEPGKFNNLYEEDILASPSFTEGILLTAYNSLPNDYSFFYDAASDDAVTNVQGSPYRRMATGEWSSKYYPGAPWNNSYTAISYINKFLDVYESVKYSVDVRNGEQVNANRDMLHKKRLKGEAHGLRAWYKWRLLQYFSGKSADGTLLGFPIIDRLITPSDNWRIPRGTFAESVKSIMEDLDIAIANLPGTYADKPGDGDWNATMGIRFNNRMNGNAAKVFKSRVALLAASPAFAEANAGTWAQAATAAGPLLQELGALLPAGKTFYTATANKEIIWNRAQRSIRNWEQNNFPPSLFGNGNTNPSQNLVDAFPMRNGYPIGHPSSAFNPNNPYSNRDVRLADYIIYNGLNFKTVINTFVGAPSNGINQLVSSTRTGYYLKKFMAAGVNLNPSSPVSTAHTYTLARMTELLLNYAEAANEAWGPDGDPNGYGFTARSKIGELRARAGITAPDPYLASIITKEEMRELIRNERRLELCFEEFRFWDIRRWKDIAAMKAPVRGVFITQADGLFSYEYSNIEERVFNDDMIYGPIPYNETLKYDIVQNKGW
jgi:starch-binding outer membrane protein, SusD/RagB family